MALTGGICLIVRGFFILQSFPIFSWPFMVYSTVMLGEKLDPNHSQRSEYVSSWLHTL